jgi:hypothetical protein
MKQALTIILSLIIAVTTFSQTDSIRGKQFQLTGKIINKVQKTPYCGVIAWGTVVEFEVINLVGMTYSNKSIGIVFTCPEKYSNDFLKKGKIFKVVFSDKNQADFGWTIPNIDLLLKNGLSFVPYLISVRETQPSEKANNKASR